MQENHWSVGLGCLGIGVNKVSTPGIKESGDDIESPDHALYCWPRLDDM